MDDERQRWVDDLKARLVPLTPHDSMAEAGRKILLADFVKMLKREEGSRTGTEMEDVHQMRVAIRRMRSALRLLKDYFKPKTVYRYRRRLRKVARALGAVRDLDVMIADFPTFHSTLDVEKQVSLSEVVNVIDERRGLARRELIDLFESEVYQEFIADFAAFLTTPGSGAKPFDMDEARPYQVRHVVPVMIAERLAAVRAFDTVLEEADAATLHALRIAFKHLRYTISFFTDILGASAGDFIEELKIIQDHLGRMNDIVVFQERLAMLYPLNNAAPEVIEDYITRLGAEALDLRLKFPTVWSHFNTRTVQRKLSDAILALR